MYITKYNNIGKGMTMVLRSSSGSKLRDDQDEPIVLHDDIAKVVTYQGDESVDGEGSNDDDAPPPGGDNDSVATPAFKRRRIKDVYLQIG